MQTSSLWTWSFRPTIADPFSFDAENARRQLFDDKIG